MPYEFNPLLKDGFQKSVDTGDIDDKIAALQTLLNSLTKDSNGNYVISIPTKFLDDVTVEGTQTIVHTQEIQSENDYIILREDNPLGLAPGAYSGFKIKNYDGNQNNCLLVVDKNGWARIGDESGTVQKIATIEENPTNGALVKYNTSSKQLESTTIPNATDSTSGLMSAADKSKLDDITPGGDFVKKFSDSEAASLNDGEIGQYQGSTVGDLVFGNFYLKTVNYNTIEVGENYVQNPNAVNIGGFSIPKGYYKPVEDLAVDCYGWFRSEQYFGGQWYVYTTIYPAVVGQKVCVTNADTREFVKFVEVASVEQASGQDWNIPLTYSDGLTRQNQQAMTPRLNGKLRKYQDFDGNIMVLGVFPDTQGAPYVNVGFVYCGIDSNDIIWPLMSTAVAEKQAQSAINIPYTTLTQQDTQPQPPLATSNNDGLLSAPDKKIIDSFKIHEFNGNSIATQLRYWVNNGYASGIFYVKNANANGLPATGNFVIQYYCQSSTTNCINLVAKMNGNNYNLYVGSCWLDNENEPTWKILVAQNIS